MSRKEFRTDVTPHLLGLIRLSDGGKENKEVGTLGGGESRPVYTSSFPEQFIFLLVLSFKIVYFPFPGWVLGGQ